MALRVRSLLLASTCVVMTVQVARAQAVSETIAESRTLGVKVDVLLPEGGKIIGREVTGDGTSCSVKLDEGKMPHGVVVQVTDMRQQPLWTHDFGYDFSATPACQLRVDISERHGAILVHFDGYKSNHQHRLIICSRPGDSSKTATAVQYDGADRDILPILKAQRTFEGHEYLITPSRFSEEGVLFGCIPLRRRDSPGAHPFDQIAPWFTVEARIEPSGVVLPVGIKAGD